MNSSPALSQMQEFGGAELTGIADLLNAQCSKDPDKEAIVSGRVRLSYAQLKARALSIAQQLNSLQIKAGDKVGLLFPNHPDYVAAFFAVVGLGAIVIPINPLLKSQEIAHILTDSNARAVIVDARALKEVVAALKDISQLEHVLVSNSGSDDYPDHQSVAFLPLCLDQAPGPALKWPVSPDSDKQLAVLVYTSGTTGRPKGAMLTHGNLLFAVGSALDAFDVNSADRSLAVLPLCHIYGLTVVMLGIFSRGGSLIIQEKFEPQSVLELIEQERITFLPAVPAMYQFMLMELEKKSYDLSSVRLCISGAAALPVDLISRIESAFQAPLIEGYGLTEVSCVANINPLHGPRKVGSVGPAFPGVQVRALDESANPLGQGCDQVGEIAIQGPNVMLGYYQQPEATASSFIGSWFLTGDLGYEDESGYFYIVGRKKELIIRGGQNIYPAEIEEVIRRKSGVADVAVIGVPDQFMGERVKAIVVACQPCTLSPEDIKDHCAEFLAEYKVPRLVDFVESLPRNSTGKVLKRLLS